MATLLGRLLYHGYHRPVGAVRDSVRAGGPWQQWRTARGRRAMEAAARHMPPLPAPGDPRPVELHLLTGRRFWYQSAFCLWSFARTSGRPIAPVLYDDGTLGAEHREPLARTFPGARFVEFAEARARLDRLLPASRFPSLHDRWQHYPNIRKLIDPHLGSTGWKLVIDSDLLFFRAPELVVAWLDRPASPLHALDCETCYGYSRALLESLAGATPAERVNVGLCGLNGTEFDWERIEHACRTLIEREGTHYFLEQAIVAMLVAGRQCTIAPEADYVTRPDAAEARACTAVMHHYVAGSKRCYFQRNWRRCGDEKRS